MKITIAKITEVKDRISKSTNKPYKLTSFVDTELNTYNDVYGEFKEGQELEGDWTTTEYGKRFEVAGQKRSKAADRQFRADPDSRESIEWQTSLKAAIEAVRDHTTLAGLPKTENDLKWYVNQIDKTAVHFKSLMNKGKEVSK